MAKAIRQHDYHAEIKSRLMEAWRTHSSVMLQMPTGTGKTYVLASVVKEFLSCNTGTVWIITHRRELVAQAEETLARYGIGKKNKYVWVTAIQWLTLHWEEVTERLELVVINETHHAQAKTYRRLFYRIKNITAF